MPVPGSLQEPGCGPQRLCVPAEKNAGHPGSEKVFIRSGIRFDYLLADRKNEFLRELCEHHVSGQLKVAPEHVSDQVLALMGKPQNKVYEEFIRQFGKMNERLGRSSILFHILCLRTRVQR